LIFIASLFPGRESSPMDLHQSMMLVYNIINLW